MGLLNIFKNKNKKCDKLAKTGEYEEALQCYNKILEKDPKNENALYNKGWTLNELGKNDEALQCYNEILELDTKNISMMKSYGDGMIVYGAFFIIAYLINPKFTFLMVGAGIVGITTGIFGIKNYPKNKLYILITGLILIISSILTYIQISTIYLRSLTSYFSAILCLTVIIIGVYDFTHNYKIAKLLDKNPKNKKIIQILTFIIVILGLLISSYDYLTLTK